MVFLQQFGQTNDNNPGSCSGEETRAMPTLTHESILLLFDNRPALAAELLEAVLKRPVEPYEQIEPMQRGLSQVVPP